MKKGDTCIQRGTIHGWTNTSDKPARMYFLLTAAKPVEIGADRKLGDEGFTKEEVGSGGSS
jgi:oxalate decarboxylase/phosphoglucose isomerase-like protein (cupin superfamily)